MDTSIYGDMKQGCYGIDTSYIIMKYFWRILIMYFIPQWLVWSSIIWADIALLYNIIGSLKYIIL